MASLSGNPNSQSDAATTAALSIDSSPNISMTPAISSSPLLHNSIVTTVLPSSVLAPHSLSSTSHFLHPSSSSSFLTATVSSPVFTTSSSFLYPPSSSTSFILPHFSPHGYYPQSGSLPGAYQSSHILTRPGPLLSSLNQANPIKLDGDNFLTWESTIMPIIRGHHLDGHILGIKAVSPEYILDTNE